MYSAGLGAAIQWLSVFADGNGNVFDRFLFGFQAASEGILSLHYIARGKDRKVTRKLKNFSQSSNSLIDGVFFHINQICNFFATITLYL